VADHARLGIDDAAAELRIGRGARRTDGEGGGDRLGGAEARRGQPRERLIGRGEVLVARLQVVAGAVDGAQAVRREDVRHLFVVRYAVARLVEQRATRVRRVASGGVALGDLDLLE